MSQAAPKEPVEAPQASEAPSEAISSTNLFFAGMAVYMILIVFVGFWPSYFGLPLSGQGLSEEIAPRLSEGALMGASWLIHLHVAVFLGWIVLFLVQTLFVARGRTRKHIKIGRWGFLLGIGALAFGLTLVFQGYRGLVLMGKVSWAEVPTAIWRLPGWADMIQFSSLLALGYLYRKRPEMHKRFMLFATAVFLHPAFGRLDFLLGSWNHHIMVVALAGPVFVYDLYTQRRVHPATLIGTAILGIDVAILFLLFA